ncbi:IclR family transcriptional regulator [Ureibacillus sinduriensis]|uniref:Glycerol operon regulatory protein n=1 Tax=Ureibacillus sinduriensis BLB-1 = JCM 15800 TaxID=1384057 RepID=A0A0A3HVC7_9BACL|nr:IclR family transcriptional regulator [Ureibacillus sinduriensis]KGR75185.1 IclR family transcriptional regulator [Ureibacillus sinduriensis BLB-1 = JCM 15800]
MATVQSIERAFMILEYLSEHPNGMQITKLATETKLSKSTVHRLLSTLIELQYVRKDSETDRYYLSYRTLYLTRNILSNSSLITVARPLLENLVKEINETVHLCVEENEEVVYVDKIESNQTIRMYSRIGSRAPMYCTGVGKMMLSGKDEHTLNEIISRIRFTKRTNYTILTPTDLLHEISNIRKNGYSLDNIENEEGIRCIAAPIYDFSGKIIASFSISGPSTRVTMDRIENELAKKILNTSRAISSRLGYVQ